MSELSNIPLEGELRENNPYPTEILDADDDNGTMPENVAALSELVVGHRIVAVEKGLSVPGTYYGRKYGTALVLDNGKRVVLADDGDCCAYTSLNDVVLNLDKIDHVITGVGTTDGYTTWHIYADLGDVVELKVGWSCGNPFYYGYGFDISVVDVSNVTIEGELAKQGEIEA